MVRAKVSSPDKRITGKEVNPETFFGESSFLLEGIIFLTLGKIVRKSLPGRGRKEKLEKDGGLGNSFYLYPGDQEEELG